MFKFNEEMNSVVRDSIKSRGNHHDIKQEELQRKKILLGNIQNQMYMHKDNLKKEKEKQTKEEQAYLNGIENFYPFGRGGGGAPNRDKNGNIITNRRRLISDPKYQHVSINVDDDYYEVWNQQKPGITRFTNSPDKKNSNTTLNNSNNINYPQTDLTKIGGFTNNYQNIYQDQYTNPPSQSTAHFGGNQSYQGQDYILQGQGMQGIQGGLDQRNSSYGQGINQGQGGIPQGQTGFGQVYDQNQGGANYGNDQNQGVYGQGYDHNQGGGYVQPPQYQGSFGPPQGNGHNFSFNPNNKNNLNNFQQGNYEISVSYGNDEINQDKKQRDLLDYKSFLQRQIYEKEGNFLI